MMNHKWSVMLLMNLMLFGAVFAQVYTGDLELLTQTDVDNFNYTEVTGSLKISGGMLNVNGLSGLTTVGGNLSVESTGALTNIDGLSDLTSVGGDVIILTNTALLNVDGLSGLTSINGHFDLTNNHSLQNCDGLYNLTGINQSLRIYSNQSLQNIDGLSALISVGGRFKFSGNNLVTNLDGLSSLTVIGGKFEFTYNDRLENLDGLSGLTSIGGDFELEGNNVLSNLNGLANVSVFGGSTLEILDHPSLDRFCGLYQLFDQNAAGIATIDISNNAINPTVDEILAAGPCDKGGLKGLVWFDANQNGQQDNGEPGLWGVTIRLTDCDGNLVSKTVTLQSGFYYLKNVPSGCFAMQVDESTLPLTDHTLASGENPLLVYRDTFSDLYGLDFGFYGTLSPMVTTPAPDPDLAENALVFVSGSPTKMAGNIDCSWDNAVDGDTEGWDGTTLARNETDPSEPPWAIFQFNSGGIFQFNIIAFQTDNGTDDDGSAFDYQTRRFEVLVSTDGLESDDFTSLGTIARRFDGTQTEYHKFDAMVSARYIKIHLLSPHMPGGWRQLVEFLPTTYAKGGAVPAAAAEQIAAVPKASVLSVFPNPFNPCTTIDYALETDSEIRLLVYDLRGREIARLAEGFHAAGAYQVTWHAGDMPSGLYFVRLISGTGQQTRRITLVK